MQKNTTSTRALAFVLFNAGAGEELTLQTQQRILAGKTISQNLCYVGAKTSLMRKFYRPDVETFFEELDNCNSTIGNIREITLFLNQMINSMTGESPFDKYYIISSKYHQRRVEFLMKIYGIDDLVEFIPAEKTLKMREERDWIEILRFIYTYFLFKFKIL